MNERIFKLAGQAISEVPAPLDFHHEHFLFAEKFAELIVKECALTAGRMEQAGRPNIGAGILDSFGVE
jgi:hypothetical protein